MAAVSPAALHSPGASAAAGEAGAEVAGGEDAEDCADVVGEGDWLACLVADAVVVWGYGCGWLAIHPVSNSAAVAAAVVMTNPCEIL